MPRLLAYVDAQLEESFSHSLQTAEQGQGQLELDVGLTGRLPCGRLLHGGSFLLADMDIAPSTTDEARKEPSLYVRIAACYGTSPGALDDLTFMYHMGARLAATDEWPEWSATSEFRAIREQQRPAR